MCALNSKSACSALIDSPYAREIIHRAGVARVVNLLISRASATRCQQVSDYLTHFDGNRFAWWWW